MDIMPKLLDDAALARKHRIALAAYGLSDEMRAALADFAKWCDETFQKAQHEGLRKKTAGDSQVFVDMLTDINHRRAWFEHIKPIHDAMMRGLACTKPCKRQAKAKAKGARL